MDLGRKRFRWLNMILSEGALDLLESMKDEKPKYFKQFRELRNERTGRRYSPSTISSRLKELINLGAVERAITKTETGREVAGYRITKKGVKALELSYEYEDRLEGVFKKG
ncbi:MAG: hypothetical protein KKE96_04160 [Candidatus Altiarchaeota archaeon]|nr:hypothetical protein [Candidatus Altiarchaeota archaeon]